MKIATIFGTRPEIIRLSQVIQHLDEHCQQTLIHTGQNYDPNLTDVFFRELDLREPDVHLGIRASVFSDQVGQILSRIGPALEEAKPDRVLLLGDTNSALAAIVAARMGIPVYHMEAGNRCYDDRVPEEINRRLIDHCSSVLMPYTQRSMENLVREGIPRERIFVTGNPIFEVLQANAEKVARSEVLSQLGVEPGRFLLATLHRAESVDIPERLERVLRGISEVAVDLGIPVILSVHPRTADRLNGLDFSPDPTLFRPVSPMGFIDFVRLEREASCVLSDSGTVQEECCIFGVPSVTLRDVTERPETLEVGSNILTGSSPEQIRTAVHIAISSRGSWQPPSEYVKPNVAATVTKILLGYRHGLNEPYAGGMP